MVDERPRRRKRRAPPKKASRRKVPPKNGPAPEKEPPPSAAEVAISAEALVETVPAPKPERAKEPEAPTVPPRALMRIPDFRRRVIQLVVRKLC